MGLLILSGCGQQVAAPESTSASRATTTAGVGQLRSLYLQIMGTAAEREQAATRAHNIYQDAMAACMAARKLPYPKSPPFVAAYDPSDDFGGSSWLLSPSSLKYSAQAAAVAEVQMAFARHSADPGPTASFTPEQLAAYNAGMASCETSVPDERDKQVALPGQGELLRRYHAMLDRVAKAGDKYGDSYRACMTAAQMPARNPDDLLDTVRGKFEGTTAPYAGHAAVGPWDAAVAFETKAVAADSSCRDGIYDEVIAQALPAVAKFKRDNASALVTLAAAR